MQINQAILLIFYFFHIQNVIIFMNKKDLVFKKRLMTFERDWTNFLIVIMSMMIVYLTYELF